MITIPTIPELYTQVKTDLESTFGGTIPTFGKNFLRAMAAVQAAKLKLYYLAIAHLQKNIFVDTADPESKGGTLERFGRVKLGRNPNPAVAAQYDVEITGTIGSVIKASTTFKSDDDSTNPGMLFVLDNEYTTVANPDTITIRALDAGLVSKLEIGDTLTATSPLIGLNAIVAVDSVVVDPLAAEDIEDYRAKAIEAYQQEPQGGAFTDYRLWAADASGVLRVYPYASPGNSLTTDVYVEATQLDSTDGKGTPSAGILSEVEDVIDFDPDATKPLNERGRRPVNVVVNALPVDVKDVAITISGYVGIDATKQATILSAVTDAIDNIRPFIDGADVLADKNDILDTNKLIGLVLNAVPGSIFSGITFTVDGGAETSYTFDFGEIPYLLSITYS